MLYPRMCKWTFIYWRKLHSKDSAFDSHRNPGARTSPCPLNDLCSCLGSAQEECK